jgi:hypothetical protein
VAIAKQLLKVTPFETCSRVKSLHVNNAPAWPLGAPGLQEFAQFRCSYFEILAHLVLPETNGYPSSIEQSLRLAAVAADVLQ